MGNKPIFFLVFAIIFIQNQLHINTKIYLAEVKGTKTGDLVGQETPHPLNDLPTNHLDAIPADYQLEQFEGKIPKGFCYYAQEGSACNKPCKAKRCKAKGGAKCKNQDV
eukprot:TRINITY_DN19593_c0_g1_i1.p1 TRINITY_DN19593_c0_g1~~TRINITY_DN19593_c0_g1_i1.p1  ORF type:complete len:109 (-),score=22.69 TRINITY_DN19593_c0_g1_i1:204-530(-)